MVSARRSLHSLHEAGADRGIRRRRRSAGRWNSDAGIGHEQPGSQKGQPLFEIDTSQYQIALDKAKSDLDSAGKQVGAGSAAVNAARANLVAARAAERKAQQDATRLARLYEEDPGTVSVRLVEGAQANRDQAQAQVTAAQADIQKAIEQMGGDDAENNTILKTALTAVAKAELDLSNTVVRATSRGVITDLRTDVGLFAGTGSPVLTLIVIDEVWINAEFTENNLGHVAVGTPVEILFDALPGRVYRGEVRSIGLGTSPGSEQPAGALPTIQNDRDWLRESQRFPVIIGFDTQQDANLRKQLRIGGRRPSSPTAKAPTAAAPGQGLYSAWRAACPMRIDRNDTVMPIGARRTFRLGLVVALSLALGYGMELQFPFFAPVFGLLLTATPAPPPGLKGLLGLILVVTITLGVGLVVTPLLGKYPVSALLIIAVGHLSEYIHQRRAWQSLLWHALALGFALIPAVGLVSYGLALDLIEGC